MTATLKDDQIILSFNYHPSIVAFIRTIEGRRYHAPTKTWSLPLSVSRQTLNNLRKLGFLVDPRINDAIKRDQSRVAELVRLDVQPDVPFDSALPLYPFQRVA